MTTKTIKTILFAALFAAMVLPFSGMGSVYAVHEDGAEHVPDGTNQGEEGNGSNLPEGSTPDGSNQPAEKDGTHGTGDQGVPDGSHQDGEADGSHGPTGAEQDGSHQSEESNGLPQPPVNKPEVPNLPADAELDPGFEPRN